MVTSSSLRWMSNALSTFNRGALEQGTEPPNSAVCPLLCVCVCVCALRMGWALNPRMSYLVTCHVTFTLTLMTYAAFKCDSRRTQPPKWGSLTCTMSVSVCLSPSKSAAYFSLSLALSLSLSLYREIKRYCRFNLWGHKHWRRWSKTQTDRGVSLCVSVWERKREREREGVKDRLLGRVIANCVIFKWRASGNSHFSARLLRVRTTTLKTVR